MRVVRSTVNVISISRVGGIRLPTAHRWFVVLFAAVERLAANALMLKVPSLTDGDAFEGSGDPLNQPDAHTGLEVIGLQRIEGGTSRRVLRRGTLS